MNANKSRIDEVVDAGNDLVESGHVQSDRIKEKITEINKIWEDLIAATEKKSTRLGEASQQQQYNRGRKFLRALKKQKDKLKL